MRRIRAERQRRIARIWHHNVSGTHGLDRYASHPDWNAVSRVSVTADTTTIGIFSVQLDSRRCLSTVQPSTRGIARSRTTTSGQRSLVLSMPLRPSAAVNAVHPFARKYSEYIRRASMSSSMTRTVGASVLFRLLMDRICVARYRSWANKLDRGPHPATLLPACKESSRGDDPEEQVFVIHLKRPVWRPITDPKLVGHNPRTGPKFTSQLRFEAFVDAP